MHRTSRGDGNFSFPTKTGSLARGFSGYGSLRQYLRALARLHVRSISRCRNPLRDRDHREGRSSPTYRVLVGSVNSVAANSHWSQGSLRCRWRALLVQIRLAAEQRRARRQPANHAAVCGDFCTISAQSYGSQSYPGQKHRSCRTRRPAVRLRHRSHFRHDAVRSPRSIISPHTSSA